MALCLSRNYKRATICLFAFFVCSPNLQAQLSVAWQRQQLETSLYAEPLMVFRPQVLRAECLTQAERRVWLAHAGFVDFLLRPEARRLEYYLTLADTAQRLLESQPDNTASAGLLAGLELERGLGHLLKRNYLSAMAALRRSYRICEANELETGNPKQAYLNRVRALFQFALASLPGKYSWIMRLLGYEGNMAEGKRALAEAERYPEAAPFTPELELIGGWVAKQLLNQPEEAAERIERLTQRYPTNPIVWYAWAAWQLEIKQAHRVTEVLDDKLKAHPDWGQRVPYLWHVLGKALLYTAQWKPSSQAFQQFRKLQAGNQYLADSWLKTGQALELAGESTAAIQAFQQTLQTSSNGFDQDAGAQREARTLLARPLGQVGRKLMEARFAYDGGQYTRALQLLESLSETPMQVDNRTEWYYRKARVLQAQQASVQAEAAYQRVLLTKPNENLWMQPFARFYLGEMAEMRKDSSQAISHYRAALQYTDYDYQNGLEQRVKAALKRLNAPEMK